MQSPKKSFESVSNTKGEKILEKRYEVYTDQNNFEAIGFSNTIYWFSNREREMCKETTTSR